MYEMGDEPFKARVFYLISVISSFMNELRNINNEILSSCYTCR